MFFIIGHKTACLVFILVRKYRLKSHAASPKCCRVVIFSDSRIAYCFIVLKKQLNLLSEGCNRICQTIASFSKNHQETFVNAPKCLESSICFSGWVGLSFNSHQSTQIIPSFLVLGLLRVLLFASFFYFRARIKKYS